MHPGACSFFVRIWAGLFVASGEHFYDVLVAEGTGEVIPLDHVHTPGAELFFLFLCLDPFGDDLIIHLMEHGEQAVVKESYLRIFIKPAQQGTIHFDAGEGQLQNGVQVRVSGTEIIQTKGNPRVQQQIQNIIKAGTVFGCHRLRNFKLEIGSSYSRMMAISAWIWL